MMPWIYYLILAVVLVGGLYLTLLNMPGLWVMVAATAIYAALNHFAYAGIKTLIAIAVLALIAELVDLGAAGAGAKKAGASRRGLWGAIIGGFVGGLFLTGLVPIPVVGTLIGICLGTFAGAIAGELTSGSQVTQSVRVGVGAAWGRLLGILSKLLFGCIILLTVVITAHPPIFPHKNVTAAPTRLPTPATMPATKPAKSA
jgi:hypothetical protein